jgi:hypothetical protein
MEIWSDATELVCEVRDSRVITDPVAGGQPPLSDSTRGRGLWLVHQVCDRVKVNSDENGTVTRIYMSLRQRLASAGTIIGPSVVRARPGPCRPSSIRGSGTPRREPGERRNHLETLDLTPASYPVRVKAPGAHFTAKG